MNGGLRKDVVILPLRTLKRFETSPARIWLFDSALIRKLVPLMSFAVIQQKYCSLPIGKNEELSRRLVSFEAKNSSAIHPRFTGIHRDVVRSMRKRRKGGYHIGSASRSL